MTRKRLASVIVLSLFVTGSFIPKFIKEKIAKHFSKRSLTHFPYWEGMTMTFRQFVINNVTRNKRLYAAYFLSSMFTVMEFFTFAMFDFHSAFNKDGFNKDILCCIVFE